MFGRLRNRIIIITMAVTTAVLVIAGGMIMLFSSATRPEPKPQGGFENSMTTDAPYNGQELEDYIRDDRREGNERLLVTLLCTGVAIEVAVFLIVYFASQKIVEPVEDAYDKQKIFIANASHELKTPLAVIQANMEALEVGKGSEKWKANIEEELTHANKLVLDLLQLAKMDAGKNARSAASEVDLAGEVGKRVEMFRPKFKGEIVFKADGSGTVTLVKQDFLQVLDILLDNATKYGEKEISVKVDGGAVAVTNDGAKISENDAEKVFDRFYQVDKAKAGAGLGLAIAKALCDQNGWGIRCESVKGRTRFVLEWG